jgi:hypothetical protein
VEFRREDVDFATDAGFGTDVGFKGDAGRDVLLAAALGARAEWLF